MPLLPRRLCGLAAPQPAAGRLYSPVAPPLHRQPSRTSHPAGSCCYRWNATTPCCYRRTATAPLGGVARQSCCCTPQHHRTTCCCCHQTATALLGGVTHHKLPPHRTTPPDCMLLLPPESHSLMLVQDICYSKLNKEILDHEVASKMEEPIVQEVDVEVKQLRQTIQNDNKQQMSLKAGSKGFKDKSDVIKEKGGEAGTLFS